MINNPINILISLPAVFLAMSFHEYAHALAAYKLGDDSPKNHGRLTLDPFVHVDWIGLIMFSLFGFGWAKPVEVNPNNFKNRKWGDIIVSIAGPISNILLGIVSYFIGAIIINYIVPNIPVIRSIIYYIVYLNILFGLLNLIPIPQFDGYHILKDLFFRKNAKVFWKYEQYSMIILLVFIFFGLFDKLVGIPARSIYMLLQRIGASISLML